MQSPAHEAGANLHIKQPKSYIKVAIVYATNTFRFLQKSEFMTRSNLHIKLTGIYIHNVLRKIGEQERNY